MRFWDYCQRLNQNIAECIITCKTGLKRSHQIQKSSLKLKITLRSRRRIWSKKRGFVEGGEDEEKKWPHVLSDEHFVLFWNLGQKHHRHLPSSSWIKWFHVLVCCVVITRSITVKSITNILISAMHWFSVHRDHRKVIIFTSVFFSISCMPGSVTVWNTGQVTILKG